MTKEYVVVLSEAEDIALSVVANSQKEWIDNAIHERCRVAIEEIIKVAVEKSIETSTQLPTSKDEIVILAFNQGWIKPALEVEPRPAMPE